MAFQNINKVHEPNFYIEHALNQSDRLVSELRKKTKKISSFEKSKLLEIQKIKAISNYIETKLKSIETDFPTFEGLPMFYQDLIENIIGIDMLKINLGQIKGLRENIVRLKNLYVKKIKKSDNATALRKEFVGRMKSMFKKTKKSFFFLDKARREFRELPSIKTDYITYCICGMPNVGKSTLLGQLTTADPEINIYPFTTKKLMLGYIGKKQIIDTPGTFSRNFREMNKIEKIAFLALKHVCDVIIFVLDVSGSCGYDIELQKNLLTKIKKKFKSKKMIIYLSKVDLVPKGEIEEISRDLKMYKMFKDVEELKKFIIDTPTPLFLMENDL